MSNQEMKKLTEKEILRQQYELLAEKSRYCGDEMLIQITREMERLYSLLVPKDSSVL